MGVDLTLLPIAYKGTWSSFDALRLDRNRELWNHISELGEAPTPQPVWCHFARNENGETTYGQLEETPYGTALTWLSAGALLALAEHGEVKHSWRNRAVWAYLAQLPEDQPVVLYWH